MATTTSTDAPGAAEARTAFAVLAALSVCHGLNDTIQSLLPAIYPVLQENYLLSFTQIGLIHLVFQCTASLLQPAVGFYTDKRPMFRLSTFGMGASLIGLVILAFATPLLGAAGGGGLDRGRVVDLSPGQQPGGADGVGRALRVRAVVLPGRRQHRVGTRAAARGLSSCCRSGSRASPGSGCSRSSRWCCSGTSGPGRARSTSRRGKAGHAAAAQPAALPRRRLLFVIGILGVLVFSKYIYIASLTSFYTFFLIERFGLSVKDAQLHLFIFLAAVAAGTFIGGPVGDRIGRKAVIWVSILGVLPFTLALPFANLFWTAVLSAIIGVVIASAFSAILVYAQQLVPGQVGMISGLFFGFAFGIAGIGAAALGALADWKGIIFVYHVCSFLPLLGVLTVFLPAERTFRRR